MPRYFFPMIRRPACPDCGQPEGVDLNVSTTGYSVTSNYQHKPECPQLRCPHGVLWIEDCAVCEMKRVENGE